MRLRLALIGAGAGLGLLACDSPHEPDPCRNPQGTIVLELRQPTAAGTSVPAPGVNAALQPAAPGTCRVHREGGTDGSGHLVLVDLPIGVTWELIITPPDSLSVAAGHANPVRILLRDAAPYVHRMTLHYAPRDTTIVLYARSRPGPCAEPGSQQCLQVKLQPDDVYADLAGDLEGFTPGIGFEYVLRVSRSRRPAPQAGESLYRWRLLEVLTRTCTDLPRGTLAVEVRQPSASGAWTPSPNVRLELHPEQAADCAGRRTATTDAAGRASFQDVAALLSWWLQVEPPDSLVVAGGEPNPIGITLPDAAPQSRQVTLHFAPRDTVMTLYVAPEPGQCPAIAAGNCLQVKTGVEDPLTPFSDPITGFTYRAGSSYTLHVRRSRLPVPLVCTAPCPAGAGLYEWRLLEILDRRDSGIPEDPSPTLQTMFWAVPSQIAAALTRNAQAQNVTPGFATFAEAKRVILERSELAGEIVNFGLYTEDTQVSIDGRLIPIAGIFMADTMRPGALRAISNLQRVLPLLEAFLQAPFPWPDIRMWYGLQLGMSGGSGAVYMEDEGTYRARAAGRDLMPYDAALYHELAHSYIGHEPLTQFLEMYVHNVLTTGSTDFSAWTYRSHPGGLQSTRALLAIYIMIGPEAMSNAYRMIYPLRPRYGAELSAEAKQVFVDHAPAALRTAVADMAATIW